MTHSFPIRTRHILSATCATALLAIGGCASVIETPSEQIAAAQTVMPLAKPGTEMTAYALPAPIEDPSAPVAAGTPQTMSAVVETTRATSAQMAIAAAAPQAVPIPQGEAAPQAAAVPVPAPGTPQAKFMPASFEAAVMEPGFDTGAPEGLEQLVESHQIIPIAKPTFSTAALASAPGNTVMASASQKFERPGTPLDAMISKYAALYEIPEALLHRVIKRESRYNPKAYNSGNYGLMQIRYNTAKGMGYTGTPDGLFDAETNLKYGAKYLRGAWMVADNQHDGAVRLYASGYYYTAKRKGLLEETGLK